MSAAELAQASEHQALHRRLCDGDALASSDLAATFLDPLAEELQRYNPQQDPHLCTEAAIDTLMALIRNPRSYNPTRGSLSGYLRMSAKRDLLNYIAREQRHQSRRTDLDPVEVSSADGKVWWDEGADPIQILSRREELEEMIASLPVIPQQVLDDLSARERAVLELMGQKERRTVAYAHALGIGDLPFAEQQHRVKQVKDRLNKKLQRAGYGHERQT